MQLRVWLSGEWFETFSHCGKACPNLAWQFQEYWTSKLLALGWGVPVTSSKRMHWIPQLHAFKVRVDDFTLRFLKDLETVQQYQATKHTWFTSQLNRLWWAKSDWRGCSRTHMQWFANKIKITRTSLGFQTCFKNSIAHDRCQSVVGIMMEKICQ